MRNIAKFTVGVAVALAITGTTVPQKAEAKAYATKTIYIVEGQSKEIHTCGGNGDTDGYTRPVKSVKIVSENKNFKAKKTSTYFVKISGSDLGKKQVVKITYKNKNTQKFIIKTVPDYKKKVVNELKGLLKDPDIGMKKAAEMYNKKKGNANMEVIIRREADGDKKDYTIDEAVTEFTTSQKKAFILEMYFRTRMSYGKRSNGDYKYKKLGTLTNNQYKDIYDGTYIGVCEPGARMADETCKALGIASKVPGSHEMNHAWLVIKATDTNGVSYWHGVEATSYAISLKNNVKSNTEGSDDINLTKKAATETYAYPVTYTIKLSRKGTPNRPTVVVPTVPTAPCPCPGCYGKLSHTDPKNAYITSKKVNAVIKGKVYTLYVHNGGGVIRVYDASGNEYPNFAILYPEYLE